jgi:hypothetical protein
MCVFLSFTKLLSLNKFKQEHEFMWNARAYTFPFSIVVIQIYIWKFSLFLSFQIIIF